MTTPAGSKRNSRMSAWVKTTRGSVTSPRARSSMAGELSTAIAEGARMQGIADTFTRAQAAQTARLTGLAASFTELPAPLQAAADRYQGFADSIR